MLNRAAILLTPKKPYLEWVRSVCPKVVNPEARWERTVYLIEDIISLEHGLKLMEKYYKPIFENELWAWHNNESNWPKRRGYKTFLKWFDVEINSMIIDVCDRVLVDDEGQPL